MAKRSFIAIIRRYDPDNNPWDPPTPDYSRRLRQRGATGRGSRPRPTNTKGYPTLDGGMRGLDWANMPRRPIPLAKVRRRPRRKS